MKDEIKEINIKMPGQILDYVDTKEHLLELFNHITNLQTIEQQYSAILSENAELEEKIKEYKMIFDAFSERPYAHRYLEEKKKELGNNKIIGLDSEMIYKDYYDLKEENKRLKEIIENLTTMTVCGDRTQIKNTAQYKLDIYKSRNEKAIEYINKTSFYYKSHNDFKNDLLNILNGDDEE